MTGFWRRSNDPLACATGAARRWLSPEVHNAFRNVLRESAVHRAAQIQTVVRPCAGGSTRLSALSSTPARHVPRPACSRGPGIHTAAPDRRAPFRESVGAMARVTEASERAASMVIRNRRVRGIHAGMGDSFHPGLAQKSRHPKVAAYRCRAECQMIGWGSVVILVMLAKSPLPAARWLVTSGSSVTVTVKMPETASASWSLAV